MKDLRWYERLEEDLLWDFEAQTTLKYMGDDMVLLLGLTDASAERMAKEAMEEEHSMFYSLEKWHPSLRTGQRLAWVHCWGIPMIAWDREYIQKIVVAIGELVDVDNNTEEAQRVDRARVVIRTPGSPAIHHTVSVDIGGEVYQVKVVKELSRGLDTCNCRRRRETWSLEEIDSDDSYWGRQQSILRELLVTTRRKRRKARMDRHRRRHQAWSRQWPSKAKKRRQVRPTVAF